MKVLFIIAELRIKERLNFAITLIASEMFPLHIHG